MNAAGRAIGILGGVTHMPVTYIPQGLTQFLRGFATHGLSETGPKTSGLLRFYKQVSVKEAPDKVIADHICRRHYASQLSLLKFSGSFRLFRHCRQDTRL